MSVVFLFSSIMEVLFVSFSAFFVNRYIVLGEPVRIYQFSSTQ
jgi:hypothetical protein